MAGKIEKGLISALLSPGGYGGHITQAKVNPATNSGAITPPLVIPWYLRGKMGNLHVEDPVAYALFDDGTGIIIDRMDGEWSGQIDYDTTTTGEVINEKNTITKGNTTTTGKTKTADVTTGGVGSLNSHTHSCPHGGTTGGPN